MVTLDYYLSFFQVDSLTTKTAVEVMRKLKAHLDRHGIPDQVVSDNGQPFASDSFQEFASTYGFEHVTSSPMYAQSNGKAENAVKTAESLLEKAAKSKRDPYLSLLDWRNTPTEGLNSSPAQRLFGQRTKTLLPTSNHLLKPKIPKEVEDKLTLKKAKQAMYYDRGAKELEELLPGDLVRIQPQPSKLRKRKEWTLARVEGKVDIRSYQVRTEDGRVYRRNRHHLRHTCKTTRDIRFEMVLPPRPKPSSQDPPDKVPVPPATPGTSESQDLPHAHMQHQCRSPQLNHLCLLHKTSRRFLRQLLQHEVGEWEKIAVQGAGIALASHQCGPGLTPGPSVTCGLSLLLVLVLAPTGFSRGAPVFPSPQKPTHPNSNSILEVSPISILC